MYGLIKRDPEFNLNDMQLEKKSVELQLRNSRRESFKICMINYASSPKVIIER